jgi:hypothetical protein
VHHTLKVCRQVKAHGPGERLEFLDHDAIASGESLGQGPHCGLITRDQDGTTGSARHGCRTLEHHGRAGFERERRRAFERHDPSRWTGFARHQPLKLSLVVEPGEQCAGNPVRQIE